MQRLASLSLWYTVEFKFRTRTLFEFCSFKIFIETKHEFYTGTVPSSLSFSRNCFFIEFNENMNFFVPSFGSCRMQIADFPFDLIRYSSSISREENDRFSELVTHLFFLRCRQLSMAHHHFFRSAMKEKLIKTLSRLLLFSPFREMSIMKVFFVFWLFPWATKWR